LKKKFLITIFLIINLIIAVLPYEVNAAIPIDTANLYAIEETEALFKKDGVGIFTTVVMYDYDGKQYPAYCLNRELPGVTIGNPYSVSIDSLVTDVRVWRTATNGYPYKSCAELGCNTVTEAFMATKQAIYCTLYGTDPNEFVGIGESGDRIVNAIKKILNDANSSNAVKVSADLNIKAINSAWQIDNIDNNYISREFSVTANAPFTTYSLEINDELPEGTKIVDTKNEEKTIFDSKENFKVIIPITNILEDGNFTINAKGEVATKPVLYGKSGDSSLQDYAVSGIMYEDGNGSIKAYYTANETKITIVKQKAETKEPLEGVEFQILDKNQNIIHTELRTNEQGIVTVENLMPGKYYVKETKTLEGYQIYDKLIEIELDFNESTKVIVNNSEKEEVKIEEEKIEIELEVENTESEIEVEQKEEEKQTEVEVKTEPKEEEIPEKEEQKETEIEVTVKLPKTGM